MDEKDPKFERLLGDIKRISGFQHQGYKRSYLKRRVKIRMRANRITEYSDYGSFIRNNPEEVDLLMDRLTVNVTEFFRNREVFDVLEKKTFPEILENKKRLKIWSAGSSEGREAYSLAMIFLKLLGKRPSGISITATDIDDVKMNVGRAGVFKFMKDEDIDKEIPPWALEMVERKNKSIIIPHQIKKMVRFVHHDLIKEEPLKNTDIVVCRNLLIYFPKDAQTIAFKKFFRGLKDDGIMIIGKTEHIPYEIKDLFEPVDLRQRIFKKAI